MPMAIVVFIIVVYKRFPALINIMRFVSFYDLLGIMSECGYCQGQQNKNANDGRESRAEGQGVLVAVSSGNRVVHSLCRWR